MGGGGPSIQEQMEAQRKEVENLRASQQQERLKTLQQLRRQREIAQDQGRARGEQLFGEGSLGRLQEGRAPEIADVIERRRAGLQGFSREELNALRAQRAQEIARGEQTALRQLRGAQAQAGVRGGLAGAQQAALIQQGQQQRAQAEQELFLRGEQAKREGLGSFEQSLVGAREREQQRQAFNIGQQQRERFGQLATELGFAGLGAQEAAAAGQLFLGEQQAIAGEREARANEGKK